MLHHIIVKWNSNVDKKEMVDKVRSMYAKADEIPGVHRVEIRENVIPRENRYDIMIVLDMNESSLPTWDASELHKQWKEKFGGFIEKKCIFDCETP